MEEYGNKIAFFETLRDKGKPTPLDEAPSFDLEDQWFINSYRRLNESKPPKMVPGFQPIPISEFCAYFNLFSAPYENDTTIDIIHQIDRQIFKYAEDQKAHRDKIANKQVDDKNTKGNKPSDSKGKKFGPPGM